MKKFLKSLIVLFILAVFVGESKAMTFEQAFSQVNRKPMAVLIYAKWAAGYQTSLQQFRIVKSQLSSVYNFVELDLASNDARAFNERFQIYQHLPYVLMFKDGGKISRYIPQDCAYSANCTATKLKSFIK